MSTVGSCVVGFEAHFGLPFGRKLAVVPRPVSDRYSPNGPGPNCFTSLISTLVGAERRVVLEQLAHPHLDLDLYCSSQSLDNAVADVTAHARSVTQHSNLRTAAFRHSTVGTPQRKKLTSAAASEEEFCDGRMSLWTETGRQGVWASSD